MTTEVEPSRTDSVPNDAARVAQPQNSLPSCRPGTGLKLKFRRAPLETVLDYLQRSAGVFIHVKSDVPAPRTVDLWHDQPVSTADALRLLKQVLVGRGCTLIQKGPIFSVIRSQDVKKHWIPLPTV